MRRILILFSDTGGGHRAAAQALCQALNCKYGDRYETILEDAIVGAAAWPFNNIPKTYFPITKYAARAWGWGFDLSNSRLGQHILSALAYPIAARGLRRMFARWDPDIVLTVHPLITSAPWRVLSEVKPNALFLTVVTDLFDAHAMWFSAPADLAVLPTEGARQRGIQWGFRAERMCVAGLPVSLEFTRTGMPDFDGDRNALQELRARLGLAPDLFTILIVGGGEGMGPIGEIASALSNSGLSLQLVVIAGRNDPLRCQLEAARWQVPVRVTGFVNNMPEWMRASDLVISKAGPGTIMESLAAGRPLIISGYLPGQEKGNVEFVEQAGVGVFRNSPDKIVQQVKDWMRPGDTSLQALSARAHAQARPEAAIKIADLLDQLMTYSAD